MCSLSAWLNFARLGSHFGSMDAGREREPGVSVCAGAGRDMTATRQKATTFDIPIIWRLLTIEFNAGRRRANLRRHANNKGASSKLKQNI